MPGDIFWIFSKRLKKINIELIFVIDSTIVRAHQHAAGACGGQEKQALGRSAGGLTSKLHMRIGTEGNPDRFILSAGHEHDVTKADELCKDISSGGIVLADKGYDSSDFRISLLVRDVTPEIPSRENRNYKPPYDKERYKIRSKVELFFAKLKQYRGFATRYDKLARNFLSQIAIACVIITISLG